VDNTNETYQEEQDSYQKDLNQQKERAKKLQKNDPKRFSSNPIHNLIAATESASTENDEYFS